MRRFNVLMTSITLSFGASLAGAQTWIDHQGTDFFISWLPHTCVGAPVVELYLTTENPTPVTVTIEYPAGSGSVNTYSVSKWPAPCTVVTLPSTTSSGPSNGWVPGTVQQNCVRASAAEEFSAFAINRTSSSADSALCLPTDALGDEYIVADYESANSIYPPTFVVCATVANTTVTIDGPPVVGGGTPPFNVFLPNVGDAWLGQSVSAGSLTGTIITADNPVAVTNGSGCAYIPGTITGADFVCEMAQPVGTWGNRVLVSDWPTMPCGANYRVIASVDGTDVHLDGAPLLPQLDRGEYLELDDLTGSHVFKANEPIQVVQYMRSDCSPGGPAMVNVLPTDQYRTSNSFCTVSGFFAHYVTVYAANSDVGAGSSNVLLDGAAIASTTFTPIPGSCFSAATLSISAGPHTTSSTAAHGLTVTGIGSAVSYVHPGGWNAAPFTPYCFCSAVNAPCSNPDPCAGCMNSTLSGSLLSGFGTPSVALDDLVLVTSELPPAQFGLYIMSANQALAPFGSGLRCMSAPITRFLPPIPTDPCGSTLGPGIVAHSLANFASTFHITAGSTWNFQHWYRDPSTPPPCVLEFNLTNAVKVTFTP